jgi:hypothetical protein
MNKVKIQNFQNCTSCTFYTTYFTNGAYCRNLWIIAYQWLSILNLAYCGPWRQYTCSKTCLSYLFIYISLHSRQPKVTKSLDVELVIIQHIMVLQHKYRSSYRAITDYISIEIITYIAYIYLTLCIWFVQ